MSGSGSSAPTGNDSNTGGGSSQPTTPSKAPTSGNLGKRPAHQNPQSSSPSEDPLGTIGLVIGTSPRIQRARPAISPPRTTGGLYVPDLNASVPDDNEPVSAIVERFLTPYSSHYSEDGKTVKLTLVYAIGRIGPENFEYTDMVNLERRRILRRDRPFYQEALQEGLPLKIYNWLNGEPEDEELVLEVDELKNTQDQDTEMTG